MKEDRDSRSEWQADLGKNSMVTSSATAYGGRGSQGRKKARGTTLKCICPFAPFLVILGSFTSDWRLQQMT